MGKVIDWDQPYGGIYGKFHDAKFEQNGVFFDKDGKEVVIPGSTPAEEKSLKTPEDVRKELLESVAGGEEVDINDLTKVELINYAFNRWGKKLDHRRSLSALQSQVKYLAE